MTVGYLNTDFELRSEANLALLVSALGDAVFILHHGEETGLNLVIFEIACTDEACSTTPDEAITRLCDLVETLSLEPGCCGTAAAAGPPTLALRVARRIPWAATARD